MLTGDPLHQAEGLKMNLFPSHPHSTPSSYMEFCTGDGPHMFASSSSGAFVRVV